MSTLTFFIKPAKADITVRDPSSGKALAKEGERKLRRVYWYRRLRDGDVVECKPPKTSSQSTSKTSLKPGSKTDSKQGNQE